MKTSPEIGCRTTGDDSKLDNDPKEPPYRIAGAVLLAFLLAVPAAAWIQFRGYLQDTVQLTVMAQRAGLAMDPGSKVTFNGVPIGRLHKAEAVTAGDTSKAKLTLDIKPRYLSVMPANVTAQLRATTVFGNKYISFTAPADPSPHTLEPDTVIEATSTTTEFNTLFETITAISEQIDPITLNQTLTAAAQALDGLGDKFGQSLVNGNQILADLNPRMPQIRGDIQGFTALADLYVTAAPDLWAGLDNAATTAHTFNTEQSALDRALLASVGFGNTGADAFEQGGPYLVRGAQDLLPTSKALDYYSPGLFCAIRTFHDLSPTYAEMLGGNGYSLQLQDVLMGVGNSYVYPDNLPRVNASGGPEGKPGCWQPLSHDLWPAPYLVMDTGASIAPYNHLELGQPLLSEYVWGRQAGENTINP